ncbi:unnamed protein product, partial [Rotaria sp. Silwood2]
MTAASAFWLDYLRDCKIDQPLPLPCDRHRISDQYRTGRGTRTTFNFGQDLSRAFLTHASTNNTIPEHLALASYFVFLFKLTNGEKDLCIGINTDGRCKTELVSVIGMFANAIPLRCQLNPSWSFARVIEEVHQMAVDTSTYSYFPLQRILAQHPLVSKPAFLDTSFQFYATSTQSTVKEVVLGGASLCLVPYSIQIGPDEIPHQLCSMRSLCAGGDTVSSKLVERIKTIVNSDCLIWNAYGPAETTIFSTCHRINQTDLKSMIPIGRPLPNYRCLIHDEFEQPVFVGQAGELLIGGVGVFVGYLNRDDLTSKVLVEVNGFKYYWTGDLVRMDSSGLIFYVGRKDNQVKIHGQRIEIGEIERCLLDSHISGCVAVKYGDDHLVAYVQGSDISEEDLRTHCRARLPPFMIPSIFVVLNNLPLNANGKVDRKRLPSPDFYSLGDSIGNIYNSPSTEMEERVHGLWCEILKVPEKKISTTATFFTIGGHSLLFIKLYHLYQSLFSFDSRSLTITPFLQQATIVEHAKLLEGIRHADKQLKAWQSLHITEGIASFPQERIYLDEQVRFSNRTVVYNEFKAFTITTGSLSVEHRSSFRTFFDDFCIAYNADKPLEIGNNSLQYIDYSTHERLVDMTKSGDFWRAELDGYNFEKHLSLPVDRCRSKTDQRSSAAYSARFSLNSDLSKSFLAYASSHNVTPFQLGLATFYVLLFKLSNGEIDLCISCVDANRYRPEIEDFVGMFIATLPYRVQIDPSRSFDHLVEQVRDKCLSILEHTHYPLQRILADSHKQQVNINFLDISFDFVNFLPAASQLNCDGAIMEPLVPDQWNETAKFDFMLTFQYDTFLEDKTISCFLVCSRDLYNEATVVKIARRFEYLLFQVFSPTYAKNGNNRSEVPLTRLTLILQEEAAEIEMMNF